MNSITRSYIDGMSECLEKCGADHLTARMVASNAAALEKKAGILGLGDDYHGSSGITLNSILIPLLALGGGGYIGYQSAKNGNLNDSAYNNIKRYITSTARKLVRRVSPKPFYDIDRYINS